MTDLTGITGAAAPIGTLKATSTSGSAKTDGSAAVKSPADDTVALRSLTTAHSLAESVKDVPVVDRARVNELREAIATGKYQPNPDTIADKMIGLEKQLKDVTS